MSVYEAMLNRRSVRKFNQTAIEKETLNKLVDVARMAPTGANRQPLYFGVISEQEICKQIFPHTKWAGYLKGTYTPTEDEAPVAYIAVLAPQDETAMLEVAAGAAVQNILVLAHDMGIGSCWLGALDREDILSILGLTGYKLLYLVALGYPAEEPKAVNYEGDVKYYLDETNTLNVPKKSVEQVIVFN